MKTVRVQFSLLFVLLVFWSSTLAIYTILINNNNGFFNYCLDDAYIHLAIANNLADNSLWQINASFAAAESSPLWTLIIASLNFIFGNNVLYPLILNIIVGSLLIIFIFKSFSKYLNKVSEYLNIIAVSATVIFIMAAAPLMPLVFSGMEHLLHSLLTLIFVFSSVPYIENSEKNNKIIMLSSAILMTALRYESVFLLIPIVLLLAYNKNLKTALAVLFAGFMPIIIYGTISVQQGWFFLPVSILLKSNLSDAANFSTEIPAKIFSSHTMINPLVSGTLMSCLMILLINKYSISKKTDIRLLCVTATASILHLIFSKTGSFYRYEAYLILLQMTVFSVIIAKNSRKILLIRKNIKKIYIFFTITFAVFLLFTILHRLFFSNSQITAAAKNIYQQQYQTVKFVDSLCTGLKLAVNDIGMISYYTDNVYLDLAGLATKETAELILNNKFDKAAIYKMFEKYEIDIIISYDSWYGNLDNKSKNVHKIADLQLKNNVICGSDEVSVYFRTDENTDREKIYALRTDIIKYIENLPTEISSSIYK